MFYLAFRFLTVLGVLGAEAVLEIFPVIPYTFH